MQLTDILNEVGGLGSIARELGIGESQVAAGNPLENILRQMGR